MNEITGDDVVEAAKAWIDTPFRWQKSQRGQGCDCKGLIAGVARDLGVPGHDSDHATMQSYGRTVDIHLLRRGLSLNMDKSHIVQPGAVVLLYTRGKPQHLAIISHGGRMIHCLGKGPKRVREVPIEGDIDSIWRFRGVRYD